MGPTVTSDKKKPKNRQIGKKNWWHRHQAKNEKWTPAKWIKIWQKTLVPPHISVNGVDKSSQDSQKIRRWVLGWRGDAIEIVVSLLPGLWAPPVTSPPTTHNRWQKHELCPRLSSVWQHYYSPSHPGISGLHCSGGICIFWAANDPTGLTIHQALA